MNLSELKLTPRRKEICERLGLYDSDAILSYYPFRYELNEKTPFSMFRIGSQVCFVGELASYPSTFRKGKFSSTKFKVLYDDEILNITIFNRPWIRNLQMNEVMTIVGRYDGNNKITASNYYLKDISGQIIPIYPLKEGISQNDIRKIISFTYEKCEKELIDMLPADLKEKHQLIDYKTAVCQIHNPDNKQILSKALSRLKYDEFLRFYTALDALKDENQLQLKQAKEFDDRKVQSFIDSFSFTLTEDQSTAVDEIIKDLHSSKIMYRLVQGEVGSGKTAVAMIALYANFLAGYQGALMAPTEILARQHYESLKKQLEPFGVRVCVLYGAMDEEKKIKQMITDNEFDVVVGTHALFSQDVDYCKLGLVIADEQHRFGVRQRQALRNKGEFSDFILMSATPIPRTLASSLYGDMDVSSIASLPAGRKGCKTYLIRKNSVVDILPEIFKKLDEGRQIYVIAAAIDKSDNYKAKDVSGLYNALKERLKPYEVALLHGKLDTDEKQAIMEDFNRNEIQVLISTTVVEVGVNVPNATMMIIYDADRFGLSQLHQLRGRVQRSQEEGTCYLLTDSNDENVIKRLDILCKSNDGFEISFEDLKIRGPGDILGTRQSGLPTFVLGNLIEDTRFIEAARQDVKMMKEHPDDESYKAYRDYVMNLSTENIIG